jgi:hypothetical protein
VRPALKAIETLPVLRRDRRAAPPDFVGVGAQRSGTSWWHALIEHHPDVQALGLTAKELHFFDERWQDGLPEADVRRYHRLFARAEGTMSGEWTPRYMHDPWTPALLRRAAPDAKLLVLLRDPVHRFVSGVVHAIERGMPVTADLVGDAVARGMYWRQLNRLLDHFPREQLLILQFERCRDAPIEMLDMTFAFLGLAQSAPPQHLLVPVNRSAPRRTPPVSEQITSEIARQYRPDLARLAVDFPEVDLSLWPSAP